jgi:hypothetical protein
VPLAEPASEIFLADCRERIGPELTRAGARVLGWYRTEYAPNNFPRLPVREGDHVVVDDNVIELPSTGGKRGRRTGKCGSGAQKKGPAIMRGQLGELCSYRQWRCPCS